LDDQHHVIQRGVAVMRVELFTHLCQSGAQLRRRLQVRIAGRIQVEPELEVLADLGIGPQIVEHRQPGQRRRQQTVNHQHRDLAPLIRLERVDAALALHLFGPQEARVTHLLQIAARQEVSQRRGQVGLQRHLPASDADPLHLQRVVELQHAGAVFVQVGNTAFETEERRDRKRHLAGKQERLAPRHFAGRGHQGHAQAIAAIVIGETDNLVIAAETEVAHVRSAWQGMVLHGQGESLAVVRGQMKLLIAHAVIPDEVAVLKPAYILGCTGCLAHAQAFRQPGVVQVARQPETRVERALGGAIEQVVISVAGRQVIETAGVRQRRLFGLLAEQVAHFGQGKEGVRLRIADAGGLQLAVGGAGVMPVFTLQVPAAQRLQGARRQVVIDGNARLERTETWCVGWNDGDAPGAAKDGTGQRGGQEQANAVHTQASCRSGEPSRT
jgi:hypothetical protein